MVAKWWGEEAVMRKTAALSFYTAFSLAPIVLLLTMLFGLIVDTETLRGQLQTQATALLGEQGGALIEGMLEQSNEDKAGWSVAFGFIVAAIGATTVFNELKGSLDDLLAQDPPPNLTIWQTIRARVLSFGVVVSLGFLLLITLLANAALAVTSDLLTKWFAVEAVWIGRLIGAVLSFGGTFALFYVIYRMLPERKLTKTAILIGSVASTILFAVGRILIGLYLGHTDAVAAFGAAGSLAVVLIWVNYSAVAFFVGALVARYVEEGQAGQLPSSDAAKKSSDSKASKRNSTDAEQDAAIATS
ncbi:MAG TPA: YihY/virulence factor BrkB family protein [Casimicrobiaceae bacterium]|nr:YihY/virulence factor BrkB family protein [Casimicrobiaceae bacterium]